MISRRLLLAGAGSAVLLAACGGDDTTGRPGSDDDSGEGSGARVLGAGFADGYSTRSVLVAGVAQRLPLVVFEETGVPVRADGPASIDVSIFHKDQPLTTITVPRHDTGIPTPYYPLTFTPPEPGDYEARAAFSAEPMRFKVSSRDEVKLVQVGDPLRPVVTPTTADARGVTPICTRATPCPFHAVTLADAIAAKKPIVLAVTTPGFCQTAICGPVLELLVELAPTLGRFQIVHAEVYVDPAKQSANAPKTTETITTYGLDYEPSLYVADAGGAVRARLDFSWDRAELEAALALIP